MVDDGCVEGVCVVLLLDMRVVAYMRSRAVGCLGLVDIVQSVSIWPPSRLPFYSLRKGRTSRSAFFGQHAASFRMTHGQKTSDVVRRYSDLLSTQKERSATECKDSS